MLKKYSNKEKEKKKKYKFFRSRKNANLIIFDLNMHNQLNWIFL